MTGVSPPDLSDDDTGRIARAAAEAPPTDLPRAVHAMMVRQLAHERADERRFRTIEWLVGMAILAAVAAAGIAYAQHGEDASDRQRLEDVQRRLDRIEAQIDRLLERSEP